MRNKIFWAKKIRKNFAKSSHLAFTLVEVLIALLVFGVGLVSVLWMVVYNITLSDNIKTQVSWTLLAKEGIEIVYNIKESNKKKDFAWNVLNIQQNWSDYDQWDAFKPWDDTNNKFRVWISFNQNVWFWRYQVEKLTSNPPQASFNEKIRLYFHSWENNLSWYYNHIETSWKESNFSRYIEFWKVEKVAWEDEDNWDKIAKITSHVLTHKWRKKEIKIETFIWNN